MIRSAFVVLLISATAATAQTRRDPNRAFEIADNSFLVEEAFNQEAGVFQNILLIQTPTSREWSFEFTQEWPVGSIKHQLSYTIPLEVVKPPLSEEYEAARGTIAINYRYQLTMEDEHGIATSPRISLLLPLHDFADNLGFQINLPASKQFGNVYVHANAGVTREANTDALFHLAGSVIYRAWPMVHLMLESVLRPNAVETLNGLESTWLVSPGLRAGLNFKDHQLVLGAAVPVGLLNNYDTQRFIAYISYELPFMRR